MIRVWSYVVAILVIFASASFPASGSYMNGVDGSETLSTMRFMESSNGKLLLFTSDSAESSDVIRIVLDENGTIDIADSWDGTGDDAFVAVCPDSTGTAYAGLTCNVSGPVDQCPGLIRFSETGDVIWAREFVFGSYNSLKDIAVTDTDEVLLLSCKTAEPPPMPYDLSILKVSSSGDLIWNTIVSDGYFNLWGESIQTTSDGGCIITGSQGSTGIENMIIVKLAADGSLQWNKEFSSSSYIEGKYVFECSDGYLIFGFAPYMTYQTRIYKLGFTGDLIWSREISSPGRYLRPYCVARMGNEDLIVSSMITTSTSEYIPAVIKMNSDGEDIWAVELTDSANVDLQSLQDSIALQNGEYLVTGRCKLSTEPIPEMLMFSLNADGTIPGCSHLNEISLDNVDITESLFGFTRTMTLTSPAITVNDTTAEYTVTSLLLTEYSICDDIEVPALNVWGLIFCLMILTGYILKRR